MPSGNGGIAVTAPYIKRITMPGATQRHPFIVIGQTIAVRAGVYPNADSRVFYVKIGVRDDKAAVVCKAVSIIRPFEGIDRSKTVPKTSKIRID